MVRVPTISVIEESVQDFKERLKNLGKFPSEMPKYAIGDVVHFNSSYNTNSFGQITGIDCHGNAMWNYKITHIDPDCKIQRYTHAEKELELVSE